MENKSEEYFQCDIERIRPNRYQPRLVFSENEIKALCSSIREQGIVQPLLVRRFDDGYELVAGERRLRAAKMAGLNQVPVVLKNIPDTDLLIMSIVENAQRKDLNPLEESEAYHRLMTDFNLTQKQIAERVGKNRSSVANTLRLRQLPPQIKDSVMNETLSMGHAKALLSAETPQQQNEAWRTLVSKDVSVREAEQIVKRLKTGKKRLKKAGPEEMYLSDLADDLSRRFGTKVRIRRRGQKGKVEIEFYNNDDLDRLINLLKSS
ncbi:ParB/RepB/Spo0J family partition protein [Desulfobacterales bacterium HSG2]|nr:ParB/RepB/Spo0J family partition protein [Desulfobacterales bacterium HSG2]